MLAEVTPWDKMKEEVVLDHGSEMGRQWSKADPSKGNMPLDRTSISHRLVRNQEDTE